MTASARDFKFFVVHGGKAVRCGATQAALLNRAGASTNVFRGREQLIAIFVKHRAEIERIAIAKLQRQGHSDKGVVVTDEDLNR